MLIIGTLHLCDDGRFVLSLEPEHIEDVVRAIVAQELHITAEKENDEEVRA